MEKTISRQVGKASQAHNSRKFKSSNVDAERTQNNVCYCNENIRRVYHELFEIVVQIGYKYDTNFQVKHCELAGKIG